MKRFIFLPLTLLMMGALAVAAQAQDDAGADAQAFLMEISGELGLSEEQTQQLGGLMAESAEMYQAAAEANEGDDEEDPKASLSEFKKARQHYLDGAQQILTPEQWEGYQAYVDQEMTQMMYDVAEIRLLDMKTDYDFTDDQIAAMTPVMGEGLKGILKVAYEYGDKKMNKRTKIKVGKQMKGIKSNMDSGMKAVMTEEQWAQYEADREAKKEQGS